MITESDVKSVIDRVQTLLNDYGGDYNNKISELREDLQKVKSSNGRSLFSGGTVESKGLRSLISNGIIRGLAERKDQIARSESGAMMDSYEIKTAANIATANLTVDNYQSYLDWRPGMEPTGQFHFRNLVRTVISATDYVQYPRANTPTGEGSFSRVAEAAPKPQVDRDYTMATLNLLPMAAYAVCSRQSLRNIVFLQSWLPESLMNQMEESEDSDFANTLVAAATGSTTTTKTVLPEKLISYMKNLIAAKYNPTAIAVTPEVWEDLLTFRPGTDNPYSLPSVVTVGPDGNIRLLNRPVIPVNWLTGRRVVVGDWSKAAIVQSEGLRLRQSDSHASLFTTNEIAFLMERVEGLAIFRPNAFITTTV